MSHTDRSLHDVVIVGGGPSGSAAGIVAARAGLSTLIIDKAQFPRDKPCGGLLSAKSLAVLDTLLDAPKFEQAVRSRHNGFRMFHKGRVISEVDGSEPVCSVCRRELDMQLLLAAQAAGCDVRQGIRAVDIASKEGEVVLKSGEKIRGRSIVVAAGAHGVLPDWNTAAGKAGKAGTGFGLVAEVPVECVKNDEHRRLLTSAPNIFFGDLPWGYGWIFPQGGVLNVGVGAMLKQNLRFRRALGELIDAHFCGCAVGRIKMRGHVLPFGRFRRDPGRENVLTVGDAAGFVEPLTGEGIAYALQSGILAAHAIRAAAARGTLAAAGDIYNASLVPLTKPLRQAAVARWLFFPRPCFPLAIRGLRRHPQFSRWYWELLAGKITYPQFFRRMATVFW